MLPSESTVANIFGSQHPLGPHNLRPQLSVSSKRQPFQAWSVIEDTKQKTDAVAKEAAREFDLASQKTQAKTGKIEPWTGKYYAACTFGGLLACVSLSLSFLFLIRSSMS